MHLRLHPIAQEIKTTTSFRTTQKVSKYNIFTSHKHVLSYSYSLIVTYITYSKTYIQQQHHRWKKN